MKRLTVLILVSVLLCGCVAQPEPTENPPTSQTETLTAETETAPGFAAIPDQIVTPGEMPEPPEGDVQLPPQPGLDVQTE